MGGAESRGETLLDDTISTKPVDGIISKPVTDVTKTEAKKPEKEMMIDAAIKAGMPNPQLPEYEGKAAPILFSELQSGWDVTKQGAPAYVSLPKLGSCQILAKHNDTKRYAVVFFDVKAVNFDVSMVVHPMIPAPRWGMAWSVAEQYVSSVDGIIKNIRKEDGGIFLTLIKKKTTQQNVGSMSFIIVAERITWEQAILAQNDPNNQDNVIFKRFSIDNYDIFSQCSLSTFNHCLQNGKNNVVNEPSPPKPETKGAESKETETATTVTKESESLVKAENVGAPVTTECCQVDPNVVHVENGWCGGLVMDGPIVGTPFAFQ